MPFISSSIFLGQGVILEDGPVAAGAGGDDRFHPPGFMQIFEGLQIGFGDPFKGLGITQAHGRGAAAEFVFAQDAEIHPQFLKDRSRGLGKDPGRQVVGPGATDKI